ncbi:DUF998 domain-containing protein [Christiangramia sabulilitoris]|uniref:DUF998 domain-containing protein n=1 Tax=Christiangramia sabulilitoris TaxID=2583991 RepID=A0A550I796_9FLAO|nr:DUF998 domain-containing protein [Christiangramia sabulilitoris]TRO66842.1 DUF998 domain-containing protein [Christiangramia sabulilitoris]
MKKSAIFKICGILGILGCVGVVAGDVIGIAVHEKHDPVSNTISMLAIGKYGWIQDLGLDILALGFFALAAGLFTWKRKETKWIISLIILVLISADLVLIAEHNQYAGRPGEKIHRILVYILAGLFFLLNMLISSGLQPIKSYLKKFSLWIGGIWLVMAPLLPLIPDNLDGAYERLVCSLIVIWLSVVSYHLFKFSDS